MASTGYFIWVSNDPEFGPIYRWTCDSCDDTDIQAGEGATIQAGNEHLGRRHRPDAQYNTAVEGWDQPPPADFPPPVLKTEGASASPSYWVSGVSGGVSTEFTWRCDLDWGWGVADSEDGVQRKIDKHVHRYHRD